MRNRWLFLLALLTAAPAGAAVDAQFLAGQCGLTQEEIALIGRLPQAGQDKLQQASAAKSCDEPKRFHDTRAYAAQYKNGTPKDVVPAPADFRSIYLLDGELKEIHEANQSILARIWGALTGRGA